MGFLKNLYVNGKENSKKDKKRLVDLVNKENSSSYGILYDIYQDLGNFVNDYPVLENPLINMAYGYSRRAVVEFMYLQGQVSLEDFNYNNEIFKTIQDRTSIELNQKTYEDTVDFQNEAANQAFELLLSYSNKYNRNLFITVHSIFEIKNIKLIETLQDLYKDLNVTFSTTNGAHYQIIEILDNFTKKMNSI